MKKYSETSKKTGVKNSSVEGVMKRGKRETCDAANGESVSLKANLGVRTINIHFATLLLQMFFPFCDSPAQNVKLFSKKV